MADNLMVDKGPKNELSSELPPDYDTGVSNGDVDWLFRGKSKKLTKKMNNPNDKRLKDDEDKDKDKEKENEKPTNLPKSKPVPESKPKQDLKPKPEPKIAPIPEKIPEPTAKSPTMFHDLNYSNPFGSDEVDKKHFERLLAEKQAKNATASVSKLDKFKIGRSRSSSNSSVDNLSQVSASPPATSQIPTRRRSSLGFISAAAGVAPINDDEPQSVSRSNSIGKTRSLFSSISSKFKSQSQTSSPATTPNLSPAPTSSNISPISTNKLNPNLIGSGSQGTDNKQDFVAAINKPLAGIPMSSKRRTSVDTTSSAQNSLSSSHGQHFHKKETKHSSNHHSVSSIKLRRVTFAIDKMPYDPQQQIPSRRPKKGNVLIPEDLVAPPPRLSQGISINHNDRTIITTANDTKYSEKELNMAIEAQKKALAEAEKHAYEAHVTAKRIAHEVSQYRCKVDQQLASMKEEDETLDHGVENIEIDKPIHVHENHFLDPSSTGSVVDEEKLVNELSLETIYTRCCHLREILPIPATLKQLKNKSKPLEVLKLLNPRPTLIDVLSFSDFISLIPINTIIFDNVTMTTEMLKHFLASLMKNKALEKLSLRNVAIDELGWKYLCKFLSTNLTIKKLDISQQRIKSDTPKNCIRSSMNWNIFIQSIVQRGGIEELVINGCKLSDENFESLINNAVILSTCRLGVASCELNLFKTEVINKWISSPNSKIMGVDLAFNDLSNGQLRPFIDTFNKCDSKLVFFSLNSTKLVDVEETAELLKSLINIKTLRFLDLSSLPDLFPGIISRLNKYLPLFPNLKRIHFDLNELSIQSIIAIAEILPKINQLVHVSFLGNKKINHECAASLYTAIKKSKSIFTLDIDYDLIPDKLSQKIAFYLMKNMDRTVRPEIAASSTANHDDEQEELMFDGSLLMETAEKLLAEDDKDKDGSNHKIEDLKVQQIITNALIERTQAVRKDIHKTIDLLFERRNQGLLSFDGKENLVRFCLLDSSLEKVVHMYEEKAKRLSGQGGIISNPQSPAPSFNTTTENFQKNLVSQKTSNENPPIAAQAMASSIPTIEIHDNLHESSTELITAGPILSPHNSQQIGHLLNVDQSFQPHQVVVESTSDGTHVPVDHLTGRPVLMRSISQTSQHAKEQEVEEGEFHRWGYFINQRSNDKQSKDDKERKVSDTEVKSTKMAPVLNVLPSGSELREAIIAAKGIESVADLIDKINNERVSIEKIYNIDVKDAKSPKDSSSDRSKSEEKDTPIFKPQLSPVVDNDATDHDNDSIDSMDDHHDYRSSDDDKHDVNAVVDEVYEKLLNDAQRVRSNK